jgi:hypothetical protein
VIVEEALRPDDEAATLFAPSGRALFSARVDPRTAARVGQRVRLAVDPARLYFFAPESGESLLSERARDG